jgi:hypothetical protein
MGMTIYTVTLLIVRLFNQAVLTAEVNLRRILNVALADWGIALLCVWDLSPDDCVACSILTMLGSGRQKPA